jgi:hypothetical protein
MTDTISVPINLTSLSAAITTRVDVLTIDSPPDDILAIIGLLEALDVALDRLALALDVTTISTVAA